MQIRKNWTKFLAALLPILLSFSSCSVKDDNIGFTYAQKGVIDLQNYDFDRKPAAVLRGEWEFYDNQLIYPDEFKAQIPATNLVHTYIPHVWNNSVYLGDTLSGKGYATYRLKVLLKPNKNHFALASVPQATAYRLYINGKLYDSSGTVGISKETSIPKFNYARILAIANTTEIEIILHVSNFHHYEGGFWRSIALHTYNTLYESAQKDLVINTFILGSIAIMAFYHLGLFFMRRKSKEPLYFGIFSLVVSLRMFITPDHYESLFTNINWGLSMWLEIATIIAAMPSFIAYLHSLFKPITNKKVMYVVLVIFAIQLAIICITPAKFYLQLIPVIKYVMVVEILYCLIIVMIALVKKIESSVIIFIGSLVLAYFSLSDILVGTVFFIKYHYSVQFGLFFFFFTQMYLLSKRFTSAFNKNEVLSNELTFLNRNLENIVEQRTAQISEQKLQIEEQANVLSKTNKKLVELDSFKQSMTGMFVHDLKNPLNHILHLSTSYPVQQQIKIIKSSGKQMLNLISNLLDLNKYEHTEMKLQKTNINLSELIYTIVEDVQYLSDTKNLNIRVTIGQPVTVVADEEIIRRVLSNLLVNAIKYSHQNNSIEVETQQLDNRKVKISVKDHGIGIAADKQQLVFQEYSQVNSRKDGNFESYGIGLAFCKLAVEAHDSQIELISSPDKGTTFYFTLDIAQSDSQGTYAGHDTHRLENELLSANDASELQNYINEIKAIPSYKMSLIRKIIMNVPENTPQIAEWKSSILKAINTQNVDLFNHLIRAATQK